MPFIDTVGAAEATGETREMYARQQAHYGYVPSYATVFSHRPHMMRLWAELQSGIKRNMSKRRFELATFAAAQTLGSTLCSLAHGRALLEFLSADEVAMLAQGGVPPGLTAAEAALVEFARAVARDASSVTQADVERLKGHGFTDGEVFDIAATAAARAFWTKVIEALGAESDAALGAMDPALRERLTVGRPIKLAEPERLPEPDVGAAA